MKAIGCMMEGKCNDNDFSFDITNNNQVLKEL